MIQMIVSLLKLLSGAKHSAHVHSVYYYPPIAQVRGRELGEEGFWDIMDMILKSVGSLYPGLAKHSIGIVSISTQTTNTVGEDLELADPEQPILL